MRTFVVLVLIGVLGMPLVATAQESAQDILAVAERLAAEFQLQPGGASGGGRSMTRIAMSLALVGAGVGLAVMAKPDYVPSQFVQGNTPMRVDLTSYLGAGNYPGHSYRLVHRREDAYGRYWTNSYSCPNVIRCTLSRSQLNLITMRSLENFRDGYIDGFDDGVYAGLVVGHEQGWHDGQNRVIEVLDANGFIVYSGEFTPASYVKETFSDKAGMRIGGVGLAAAGALIALFWPDSPARNLDLGYVPGGGARVGASFRF